MYLWRRRATRQWWAAHEQALRGRFDANVAVIEQPNRKTLQVEITCESPAQLKGFGGRARKLPRDWPERFLRREATKPIAIGERQLVIPAGAAFGTGEHATTSMCLTMLKQLVRRGDDVVDLGTGSGILALAARLLGANRVVAIDNDPVAIRTARHNARRNKVRGVQFIVADARKIRGAVDVVCANLFSELLIDVLPNWRGSKALVLSGILRTQERDVTRAIRANGFAISVIRRRGKWIAIRATTRR